MTTRNQLLEVGVRAALTGGLRIRRGAGLAAAAGLGMLLTGSGDALAQDAGQGAAAVDGGLETIVVTARRKEESLQEVPVAVTAISGENLEQNVLRAEDLARIVPSLTVFPSSRGNTQPNYMIRGQRGSFDPNPLVDPAVTLYFAEMNLARSQGTNQALYDLQSVQVLKGPQGTLFGRNSTGGAVLFTPNAPVHDFEGYGKLGIGDYGYSDFEGVVNLPLGNASALRVGGKITQRDGYMTNTLNGQMGNDIDATSARASLLIEPSDALSSTFIGTYYSSKGVGFVPKLDQIDPRGIPPLFVAMGLGGLYELALTQELAATEALDTYEYRGIDERGERDVARSIQNNTLWNINGGVGGDGITLKNIIGYRTTENEFQLDFIGSGMDLFYNAGENDSSQLSEEFQVQGTAGNLGYIAGLFYFNEDGNTSITGRQFGFYPKLAPIPPLLAAFPIYTGYDVDYDWTSYAAFLHGDYDLGGLVSGLSISAGLRWTRDEREVDYHNIQSRGTPRGGWFCDLEGKPLTSNDPSQCSFKPADQSNDELTYDISFNYQLSDDMLVYLAHRKGYRTGGYNARPIASVPLTFEYGPEYVKDVELGFKSEFALAGVPTRLNTALYYQWYEDVQRTQGVVDPSNGSTTSQLLNAASATIKGGELEITMQPTDNLTLAIGYAYTSPEYDEWIAPYYPAPGVTKYVDISDSEFAMVPEHQWNVTASYAVPLSAEWGELAFSVVAYGITEMATIDNNSPNCGDDGLYTACYQHGYNLDGYELANVRVDWRDIGPMKLSVGLFVNNVTDEYYENFAMNTLGLLGTASVGIGAPQMWGLEFRLPFGAAVR